MNSREIIIKATDGLLRNATNGILWWLFLTCAGFGKSKTSYGAYQMFREADEALASFHYDHFKQFISKLQRDGLIHRKKRYSMLDIEITDLGRKRIASFFPIYHTHRPWDRFLYLISYDIPETHRGSRDVLRRYLKQIGCALLQESLWVTPYAPRKLLNEFMNEHNIQGTVIVSKLGKNGAIGEERMEDLLEKVYRLHALNDRYIRFLSYAKQKVNNPFKMAIEFQEIVADDPQLPFPLLPKGWKGNEAFEVYKEMYK